MEASQITTITSLSSPHPLSLRLNLKFKEDELKEREVSPSEEKRVTWAEDTIDNEHMGKKKSNICCIYCPRKHTPAYDEQHIPTCSSDDTNELERSNQSKRCHLEVCSKVHGSKGGKIN